MELSEIRKNGIFYTPAELAELLVKPLIMNNGQKVFDPAYGEGSLLLAAEKMSKAKKIANKPKLFGCDIKPVNGLLKHLPEANLKKIDFFNFSTENKFDVIFMNPPYVRHHFQDGESIGRYRQRYPDLNTLGLKSDLWAYFLMKATMHLNHQGSIGAILPWSFIQAEYSKEVRKWLLSNFGEITLLGLNDKYFDRAEARIVLLWLNNFGLKNSIIKMGLSQTISTPPKFRKINTTEWTSQNVISSDSFQIDKFLSAFQQRYGFNKLSQHCDIKIGVVSGADDLFLIDDQQAKEYKFTKKHLIPIVSNSKQFNAILRNELKGLKKLVCIGLKDYGRYKKFVDYGKRQGFHLREHSKRRKPWYSVNPGKYPDAFFPYRVAKLPFILSNNAKLQCTNSVHRLYFKECSVVQIKWIQVALLSIFGQLSLEAESKTYGKMMLKVEPAGLKNALVFSCSDEIINNVHQKVYDKLKNNDKEGAMLEATHFITHYLKVSDFEVKVASKFLQRLQTFRLG
jgi:adenine-specific DNA-methyltransferase